MTSRQAPSRLPWPPLILVAAFATAWAAGRRIPVPILGGGARWAAGPATIAAGLALDVSAVVTLRHHRANILPYRAATALVTTGPFALSRHPIYLGNAVLLVGAALLLDNAWMAAAALAAFLLVRRLAALPEERHLVAHFGDDYRRYCAVTPRWLRLGAVTPANDARKGARPEG